jgi:hypothetical protein
MVSWVRSAAWTSEKREVRSVPWRDHKRTPSPVRMLAIRCRPTSIRSVRRLACRAARAAVRLPGLAPVRQARAVRPRACPPDQCCPRQWSRSRAASWGSLGRLDIRRTAVSCQGRLPVVRSHRAASTRGIPGVSARYSRRASAASRLTAYRGVGKEARRSSLIPRSSGYVSLRSQPPGTEHLGRVLSFICLPRMSFVERKKTMAVCPAFR